MIETTAKLPEPRLSTLATNNYSLIILGAAYFDRTLEDFDSTVTLVILGSFTRSTSYVMPKVSGVFIFATG